MDLVITEPWTAVCPGCSELFNPRVQRKLSFRCGAAQAALGKPAEIEGKLAIICVKRFLDPEVVREHPHEGVTTFCKPGLPLISRGMKLKGMLTLFI